MKKIHLEIVTVTPGVMQNNSYAVILGERNGRRRLPVVIGVVEARAIASAIERMNPARPLTHDLVKNLCEEFDIQLCEVIISNLVEGVFHATLVCERHGERVEIDSRTSDAIALAVRFNSNIYTYDEILDQAGIEVEDVKPNKSTVRSGNELAKHTPEQLQTMLDEAIENEDYEKAARLRDELKRR